MKPIYLDYAATTPVDPAVFEAMTPYLQKDFGNPSSVHQFGRHALTAVEKARREVAELIGAAPSEIVFTSGGTESDNTAIKSAWFTRKKGGRHIITSAIEHHGVLAPCHFLEALDARITLIPVDSSGIVDPDDIKKAITNETVLISIMHANNEIGTIQPLHDIGCLAKEREILFHTDAVQTAGHVELNVNDLHLDFLSLSAHKLYGPKGVGALYIRKGTPFEPLLHGGGHEKGRRSSTHNVPGIVGLGCASAIARSDLRSEADHVSRLRDLLWTRIENTIPEIILNGSADQRLPNNLNVSVAHVEGESLLMNLDMEGIAVSTGSACSSDSGTISHVLKALGLRPDAARGSLRITPGKFTTREEIDAVSEILPKIVNRLRSMAAY